MNEPRLNQEEQEILDSFEAGEFKSVLTAERRKFLQASAKETTHKDKSTLTHSKSAVKKNSD